MRTEMDCCSRKRASSVYPGYQGHEVIEAKSQCAEMARKYQPPRSPNQIPDPALVQTMPLVNAVIATALVHIIVISAIKV